MERETASQLLAAVYALDAGFGDIDAAISKLTDEQERQRYARALGDIFLILFDSFILPIENEHPELAVRE
ncbi:hypothetical protein [Novosphingobium sp.]|uniref:hypothetical protein n=1 Tax=Novosphingobium sp. TaxID=1874826 RepID=UPI001DE6AC7E|nr:hypothetical protein [Novosphingobium sp.]MBX9662604.1 hypothetical protein [Novosphingobium sp.]